MTFKLFTDLIDALGKVVGLKAIVDLAKAEREAMRRTLAVGTAAVALSVLAAPLTPVALATAGLGLGSGTAIPGAEWLLDWRDGKKAV